MYVGMYILDDVSVMAAAVAKRPNSGIRAGSIPAASQMFACFANDLCLGVVL